MKRFTSTASLCTLVVCAALTGSLTGCASVIATSMIDSGSLVFAGTRANLSVIQQDACKDAGKPSMACAYDRQLRPLSVLDLMPSLVVDVVLLPVTAPLSLATSLPPVPKKESGQAQP